MNMKVKSILLSIVALLLILAAVFLTGCQSAAENSSSKRGLIKVTIMYPNEAGKTFDMDYYANKHMPMLSDLFGDVLMNYEIDSGISGRTPEDTIPFLAIGYLYFDTVSDYRNAFGPHADTILSDIPNYTNIQPTVQISEVVK